MLLQRILKPSLKRTLRGLRGEWDVLRKQYHEGADPFEWIPFRFFRRAYWDYALRSRLPLAIGVEMNSHCNRQCPYCPVSITPRPKGAFDERAFQTLIDELARLDYAGQIVPSFYGEPLLDARITRFVSYASTRLPRAYVMLYTNADALNPDRLVDLINHGVQLFSISQHDPTPSPSIQRIQAFIAEHPEYRRHVQVRVFAASAAPDRKLTSRGGLIYERRVQPYPRYGCFRSRRCTITFDGSMVLCCEDYNGQYVYGNVLTEGFLPVWRRSLPQRREIFLGNYTKPICRVCVGLEPASAPPRADSTPLPIATPASSAGEH